MITKIIGLLIFTDGLLSILLGETTNKTEKYNRLLQIGRTIRTTLGITLILT